MSSSLFGHRLECCLTQLQIATRFPISVHQAPCCRHSDASAPPGMQEQYLNTHRHGRRPGAEFGGTKKFFRGPISGKKSIFRVKISDDLFFSHRPSSSDFSFLFPHFPYVYHVKCRIYYDHFLTRKTQFSLCSCFHAHPTTLLLKILGGTNAWAVPH